MYVWQVSPAEPQPSFQDKTSGRVAPQALGLCLETSHEPEHESLSVPHAWRAKNSDVCFWVELQFRFVLAMFDSAKKRWGGGT